jgi:glycerophosphoryl diester phosphodiesterase
MQNPLVIAHRGDSSHGLENSLAAFRLALEIPVDLIEFDLRMSRDGGLYVLHDRHTGRTADRNIDIERATSGEIAAVRLTNGEPLPRLDDVLQLARGRAGVNVEIKSDGAGAALAKRLREAAPEGDLIVSSFKEGEVANLRKALPDIPVGLIYDAYPLRRVPDYEARGYPFISLRKNTVTEPLVAAFHSRSVKVFVWTVDDEDVMKRCIEWQVDGIYTNRPLALKSVIEKMQRKK